MQPSLLVIGWVWPEPVSSAAGQHLLSIMRCFLRRGFQVTFASPAQPTEFQHDLEAEGIACKAINLNCESFDAFLVELMPDVVLFDRFMMEEQFGWRVDTHCPNALKILDTEDLQCLRDSRHRMLKAGIDESALKNQLLQSELACREIAALLRCDLALIISDAEMRLLTQWFNIDSDLLLHLPFMVETTAYRETPGFDQRRHFVTIGNFRHAPNWDALLQLQKLWPAIRERLLDAELHIYGAYMPPKAQQLNQPKLGVHLKGRAEHAVSTLSQYRLCLANLRFGAGIKGKLLDAMLAGTPSITTRIGSEGMDLDSPWPGAVTIDDAEFIDAAVNLYQDSEQWQNAHDRCQPHCAARFDAKDLETRLMEKVETLLDNLSQHRIDNFAGRMLKHHSLRSTQYMAQWIEAKNKLK